MSKYSTIPGLVEDLRHAVMTFRRQATPADLAAVKGAPGAVLQMARRTLSVDEEALDADRRELELADHLVHQFEEAIVILGSMIPD